MRIKAFLIPVILWASASSLQSQNLGPFVNAYHSVGLNEDGTVYTWGRNNVGQLGDNTTTNRSDPIKVLKGAYSGTTYLGDDSDNKITAVAIGYRHSMALATDGTVYAWGANGYGQLGDNTTTNRSTPIKVLEGAYSGTTYLGDDSDNKIIAVSTGVFHSLALANDGTVFAWGANEYGNLGDNSTTNSSVPVKVEDGAYSGTTYLGDNSDNKITAVSAGGNYPSIALAEDGTVFAWGYNAPGNLGDGTTTSRSTPVKVLKGAYSGTTYLGDNSSNKIISVAAGESHSVALARDGSVFAWGRGTLGQLGDGTSSNRSTPVKVTGVGGSGYLSLDKNAPTVSSVALASDNSTLAVTFSEAVYTTTDASSALVVGDFAFSISGG